MRSNNKVQLLLIALVLALGIGYAYINSDLNINGTAQVRSANWDIHWANIQVDSGSVSASSPTISNQTTVNYSVILNTPGDYYEFTVDAVNGGTIDAMIDTISSKLNGATITTLPAYLKYTVTYADGVELEPNHKLLHNTTEKYKVRIEYNTDIELNQIPASNQTLSLQFTVTYRQITDNAIDRPMMVYTANQYNENVSGHNIIQVGQAIPNSITQYTSATDALNSLRTQMSDNYIYFYLKHKKNNNIAEESYVEFIINDEVATGYHARKGTYQLKWGANGSLYAENKATLNTAFGSGNCREFTDSGYVTEYECVAYYMRAHATTSGLIIADNYTDACYVWSNGSSYCGPYDH